MNFDNSIELPTMALIIYNLIMILIEDFEDLIGNLSGMQSLSYWLIWNINNDFAFIRYQGAHATEGGDFEDFFELWLSLVILVGPLLYYYSVLYPLKKIRSIKKLNENSDKINMQCVKHMIINKILMRNITQQKVMMKVINIYPFQSII